MQTAIRFVALLAVAALSACATRVYSEHAQSANFASYHNFYWQAPSHQQPVRNPILDSQILDERVRSAVVQTLQSHGYAQVETPAQADFIVTYLTSTQQEVRSTGGFRVGIGFGAPFYDPFFGSAFYPVGPYDVQSYEQADLIIDVIDARTQKLVWRGWTSGEATQANYAPRAVDEAVSRILSRFPPK